MSSPANSWQIYRTRFLIKAKQLDSPLVFTDPLGREHHGVAGDYLVESSDGLQRIAPREIFEDIYVPMGPAGDSWPSPLDSPNHLAESRLHSNRAHGSSQPDPLAQNPFPENRLIDPRLSASSREPQLNPRLSSNRSFVA